MIGFKTLALTLSLFAVCALEATADDWNLFAAGPPGPPVATADTAESWNLLADAHCPCGPDCACVDCRCALVSHEAQSTAAEWNLFAGVVPAAAAEDTRPVVECLVPSFTCPICDWWRDRGDKDLPFRLLFVLDDQAGQQKTPQGEDFGWPLFRMRDPRGTLWDVYHIGRRPDELTRQWRRITQPKTPRIATN